MTAHVIVDIKKIERSKDALRRAAYLRKKKEEGFINVSFLIHKDQYEKLKNYHKFLTEEYRHEIERKPK